jgi:uncharacterized protein (DUF433 family)
MVDHPLIVRDREIMSGMPVFAGSRVSIKALFDWLAGGYSLDEFLDNFPSVSREKAQAIIELAREQLVGDGESPFFRDEEG